MGTHTEVGVDLSPLTAIIGSVIGSPQRFKQVQLNQLMELMSRHKPWTMKPGAEQKQWYETNVKYQPPKPREWFRGEHPEYLLPPAKGKLSPLGTTYEEPEGGVYFEEPAQPPLWTEKDYEDTVALGKRLYPNDEQKVSDFVAAKFGAPRPLVGRERDEEAELAGIEVEKILEANPDIANEPNPVKRASMIRKKLPPNLIAPFTRTYIPRMEAEERLAGAAEAREETKRYHGEAEKDRTQRTGIMKDREKRASEDLKFRQDLAKAREKRLSDSDKTAKGAKSLPDAMKAVDMAYQNYLKEFRWEISTNNKLQAEFLKRAQAVGDSDFIPTYRNPLTERPMSQREWLESDEGYPYAQRIRELKGQVTQTEGTTIPVTPKEQKGIMDEVRQGMGLPLPKKR